MVAESKGGAGRSWRVLAWGLALFGASAAETMAFPRFDGEAAWKRVETQVRFGPRVPGTPGHAACLRWMEAELAGLGLPVQRFDFRLAAPASGDTLDLTNLLVRFAPDRTPRLLLGAHWDTRPWSDEEKDPALRSLPVPGANDGGSGVAVLLGLAEHFRDQPPPIGVDLAFFDAEDQGRAEHPREFSLGSQWMVRNWEGPWPDYVLVLDMVGTPLADFGRDLIASQAFPDWTELVFQIAEARGYTEFQRSRVYTVFDDHVPFLEVGIPSAVIIGFDDPYWHTQRDVPAAVSPERLRRVGEVVLELAYGGYLGGAAGVGTPR